MTKRFLVYVLIAVVAFAFYSYTAHPLLLAVTLFMVLVALISWLALIIASFGIRVEADLLNRDVKRLEPFTLRLTLRNRSPIHIPALRISLGYPDGYGKIMPLPTDADGRPDYEGLTNVLFPDLDPDDEADRTIMESLAYFWHSSLIKRHPDGRAGALEVSAVRSRHGSGRRRGDRRTSDRTRPLLLIPSREEDARRLAHYFYRPSRSYAVFRRPLLFPRPKLVDERKIHYLSLAPRETVEEDLYFIANHKGVTPFGVDHIMLKDWFGFFFITKPIRIRRGGGTRRRFGDRFRRGEAPAPGAKEPTHHPARTLVVEPSVDVWAQAVAPTLADPDKVMMAPNSPHVSPEIDTLANIREYQPGDRMKSIHWNVSARSNEWMVREFEDPRQGGILFLMQPRDPEHDIRIVPRLRALYEDQMSEVMASLMDWLAKGEGPLTWMTPVNMYEAPGEGQPPRLFYHELATWRPENGDMTLSMLLHEATRTRNFRGVVIVTSELTDALRAEMLRLQKRGLRMVLGLLHPASLSREDMEARTHLLHLSAVHLLFFPCEALVVAPTPVVRTSKQEGEDDSDGSGGGGVSGAGGAGSADGAGGAGSADGAGGAGGVGGSVGRSGVVGGGGGAGRACDVGGRAGVVGGGGGGGRIADDASGIAGGVSGIAGDAGRACAVNGTANDASGAAGGAGRASMAGDGLTASRPVSGAGMNVSGGRYGVLGVSGIAGAVNGTANDASGAAGGAVRASMAGDRPGASTPVSGAMNVSGGRYGVLGVSGIAGGISEIAGDAGDTAHRPSRRARRFGHVWGTKLQHEGGVV